MLDLHCHILPGIDDGAQSLDEALSMARLCAKDGINCITATPHCNRQYRLLKANIVPLVARLNRELANAEIPLTILPGSEIQVTNVATYRREFEEGLYCHLGAGTAFTLFELPWNSELYPEDAPQLVAWLRDRGMTPLVAHPERQSYLGTKSGRLRALVDAGAWIQVTVDSLLGNHGPAPQTTAVELLRIYPLAVLATDAHNLRRCSGLSAGYAWARSTLGAERAAALRSHADQILSALLARS